MQFVLLTEYEVAAWLNRASLAKITLYGEGPRWYIFIWEGIRDRDRRR